MRSFSDYLSRKLHQDGERFDPSELDKRFIPFYESGQRIKVSAYGETVTGTVGVTTGWKPCFLLMRSSRSIGSSYCLWPSYTLEAVKVGRSYRPVK